MKYPRQNIDVCILTDPRYVNINEEDPYCQNILKEDGLVRESLEKRGLRVDRLEEEAMMIQEFQEQVPLRGEVAFMLIDGQFSHAILKKAREGDFRVQDDFGGKVHHYQPSDQEIYFAEDALATAIMRTYFTD